MGEKQTLTEIENKRLLKKIGRLEQEILELKSRIASQEKEKGKNSPKRRRKKSKGQSEQSPLRSASKKTNCDTGTGLESEKGDGRIFKCLSRSSNRGYLETTKGKASEFDLEKCKIRTRGLIFGKYRSSSKEYSFLEPPKERKKQPICSTCLRLMNKGYSTRFCPTHGSYGKSYDKFNNLQ